MTIIDSSFIPLEHWIFRTEDDFTFLSLAMNLQSGMSLLQDIRAAIDRGLCERNKPIKKTLCDVKIAGMTAGEKLFLKQPDCGRILESFCKVNNFEYVDYFEDMTGVVGALKNRKLRFQVMVTPIGV